MSQSAVFQDLGQVPYQDTWNYQEQLLQQNVRLKQAAPKGTDPHDIATQHHLLFCEHNPVYTLGKSGKEEHLLINEEFRKQHQIEFFKINRGGDITFHGLGQLVAYPIFDLEKFKRDISWYLRTLEDVVINFLADYGLTAGRIDGATGVWVDVDRIYPRKICAMGVRCSRWITMHGIALNINTDLTYFSHIVPCGIDDKGVTSLQSELNRPIDMQEAKDKLQDHFAKGFDLAFQEQ